MIDKRTVGVLGEVHPLVRQAFGLGLDLEKPVLAADEIGRASCRERVSTIV